MKLGAIISRSPAVLRVLAHAGRSGRRVVSAFVATAFAQDDAEAAKAQWRRMAVGVAVSG